MLVILVDGRHRQYYWAGTWTTSPRGATVFESLDSACDFIMSLEEDIQVKCEVVYADSI